MAGSATINHGLPTSPPARGVGAGGCLQATVGGAPFGGCDDADSSGVLRFTRIEYARDDKTLFTFDDPEPYLRGWFGFRTVASHFEIQKFRVWQG